MGTELINVWVLFFLRVNTFCPAVNTTGNYRKKSPGSYFGRITGADYVCCLTSVVLPKT